MDYYYTQTGTYTTSAFNWNTTSTTDLTYHTVQQTPKKRRKIVEIDVGREDAVELNSFLGEFEIVK